MRVWCWVWAVLPGHAHRFLPSDGPGHCGSLRVRREVSAVTGAALFIRRSLYVRLGGMDEEALAVAYNDIDLCLKAREAGFRNLYSPRIRFLHHESITRGEDTDGENAIRLGRETKSMQDRWGARLTSDPFYHPCFTLAREDFALHAAPRSPMLSGRDR
jgi:O-antigen biosynthesis protein